MENESKIIHEDVKATAQANKAAFEAAAKTNKDAFDASAKQRAVEFAEFKAKASKF